jgi:hypothetical protein
VRATRIALISVSGGLSAALVVGILKVVDSNHQERPSVVYGYMAATAIWVSIALAIWIAYKTRRRKR